MSNTTPPSGILLFAHGARDAAWARPFEQAAALLAARAQREAPGTEVRLAFLEFMSPDILQAGHELADAGCRQVTVVPLFLGAGGHVRKDLPRLLGELSAAHPTTHWQLSPAVGETDLLIQALSDTAWQLSQTPDQTNARP